MAKNLLANAEALDSVSRSGRSPGERNGYPLECSSLKTPIDRGTRQAVVRGVAKESDTTEQLASPSSPLS